MDLKDLISNVGDNKISEETNILISSLPSCTDFQGKKLCNYQGCWYYYNALQGVLNFQAGFKPQIRHYLAQGSHRRPHGEIKEPVL
ncbi:hypothetical protein Bca52824_031343 [Brassica carinata]|uniref:Uncharacterized protein n=1 Tax=Brassica carinata TaxID=52824 RepID=A0A8X7SAG9_BRACI|nr:hypothetical protein Bca52824_031343 [Brassica carinata]